MMITCVSSICPAFFDFVGVLTILVKVEIQMITLLPAVVRCVPCVQINLYQINLIKKHHVNFVS